MTAYGCCSHCTHGPGYIHTHPCLARMHVTPEEVNMTEPTLAERLAASLAEQQDRDAEASQEEIYEADGGDTMHDDSHS